MTFLSLLTVLACMQVTIGIPDATRPKVDQLDKKHNYIQTRLRDKVTRLLSSVRNNPAIPDIVTGTQDLIRDGGHILDSIRTDVQDHSHCENIPDGLTTLTDLEESLGRCVSHVDPLQDSSKDVFYEEVGEALNGAIDGLTACLTTDRGRCFDEKFDEYTRQFRELSGMVEERFNASLERAKRAGEGAEECVKGGLETGSMLREYLMRWVEDCEKGTSGIIVEKKKEL